MQDQETMTPEVEETKDYHPEIEVVSNQEPEAKGPAPDETIKEEAPKEAEQNKKPSKDERRDRKLKQLLADRDNELATLREQVAKNQPKQPDGPPSPEDFDNVIDYLKADRDFALREAFKQRDEQAAQQKAEQDKQVKIQNYEKKVEEFVKETPDYYEKVNPIIEAGIITPTVEDAILNSDMSEQVAYHLANNLGDVQVLLSYGDNKPAVNAAMRVIENYIEENRSAPRKTNAAPPIKPVKPQSGSTKVPDDMTQAEFERWMNG